MEKIIKLPSRNPNICFALSLNWLAGFRSLLDSEYECISETVALGQKTNKQIGGPGLAPISRTIGEVGKLFDAKYRSRQYIQGTRKKFLEDVIGNSFGIKKFIIVIAPAEKMVGIGNHALGLIASFEQGRTLFLLYDPNTMENEDYWSFDELAAGITRTINKKLWYLCSIWPVSDAMLTKLGLCFEF